MKEKIYIPIRISEEILTDEIAKKLADNKDKKILLEIVDTDFTSINIKKQEEILDQINKVLKEYKAFGIKILSTPDSIDRNNLKLLKKYKVKTIELGVQSANNYILKNSNRGHTFEDVKKASKMIRWHGFKLGHQMMVGLPESTRIDEINTAKELIKLKPKMVRIYPVLVIHNTKLEKDYLEGKYKPLTVVQAVERCKEIVPMFRAKGIDIIRIGLQNTDEITDPSVKGSEVVAGPYHPAFRQLVESSMWYDAIVGKIKRLNVKVKEVKVTVNPSPILKILPKSSALIV